MDLINNILTNVVSQLVANAAVGAYRAVANAIRSLTRDQKASKVLEILTRLGQVGEDQIRRLVRQARFPAPIPATLREELTHLLINLTKSARFHTTNGTRLSSYVRCEQLIDQLLSHIHPRCSKGDRVDRHSDWVLDAFLGMGGFGEVWRATNRNYPGYRAFKFFTDPASREWVRNESAALFDVKRLLAGHPNVIDYLDIATNAQPFPYLALEYIGGGSLEDWILLPDDERLPLTSDEVIAGIVEGLAEAHRHGITHRDLKPANILLAIEDGTVIPTIADFGLSRPSGGAEGGSRAAATSAVLVGTQMYLPPEASSYAARHARQDDLFALGVTWYQLLTQRLERPPYDYADRLRGGGIPERTIRLLGRCLAHPDRRFQSAEELRLELANRLPGPEWEIPEGCYDVGPLAVAYFQSHRD